MIPHLKLLEKVKNVSHITDTLQYMYFKFLKLINGVKVGLMLKLKRYGTPLYHTCDSLIKINYNFILFLFLYPDAYLQHSKRDNGSATGLKVMS